MKINKLTKLIGTYGERSACQEGSNPSRSGISPKQIAEVGLFGLK